MSQKCQKMLATYDFIKKMHQRLGRKSFDVFYVQRRGIGNVTTKPWRYMRKLIMRHGLYLNGAPVGSVGFLKNVPYNMICINTERGNKLFAEMKRNL